jgi:sensor histidine kinase YesM
MSVMFSNAQRRLATFWPLQLGGWVLYGVATAVVLPFSQLGAELYAVIAQFGSSFVASFILYFLCHSLWRRGVPILRALCYCGIVSYVLGFLCTVASRLTQMYFSSDVLTFGWGVALAEAVSASLILDGWCALYFGIKHYQTVQEQQSRLLASETTAREAQLLALHYQLQPHFLFNTLNAISTLVISQQPVLATEMIAKLAALLRNTLSFPNTHTVALREELLVIEEYLAIERVRFGARLRVSFEVGAAANDAQVPRFLLQPLVENAIRHAIARPPEGGAIDIAARISQQVLIIEVANDTCDTADLAVDRNPGVGLANTRSRLAQLYGESAARLALFDTGRRFRVSIELPLSTVPIVSRTVSE